MCPDLRLGSRILLFLVLIFASENLSAAQELLAGSPEALRPLAECPLFSETDESISCYAETVDEDPTSDAAPGARQDTGESTEVLLMRVGNFKPRGPAFCANINCGLRVSYHYCPAGQVPKPGFGQKRDCKTVSMNDQVCYDPNRPEIGANEPPACPNPAIAGIVIPIWKTSLPFTSNPNERGACVPDWDGKRMQEYWRWALERCGRKQLTEFECQGWCDVQFRGIAEALKECYLACRSFEMAR